MVYPKISIITPSFNQGNFLEETILSVIGQNYPNLEYIIIDGGSTDHSVEIIKKYESKLAYWISEKDKGIYDALQKGFEKSSGEIMGWINSDDMYHKKSLFTVSEIFQNISSVKWIQGCPSTFDENSRTVSVSPVRDWSKFNFYLKEYQWIQQESTFWKRSLWEKAGGYIKRDLKYAADLELWLRFFRHELLYVTPALIGGFRARNNNQLSLEHLQDYIKEAETCILAEPVSDEDKNTLAKIQYFRRMNKLLRFKAASLKTKEQLLYKFPARIVFNRKEQKFELKK